MLIVPTGAQAFSLIQSNASSRPLNNIGMVVTPSTTEKGAWVQTFASVSNDSYGLLMNINSNSTAGTTRSTLLDVGVDPAGGTDYQVLIPNLICGGAYTYYTGMGGFWYFFPIFIPAGASVAVRAHSTATNGFRIFMQLLQEPLNPAMVKTGSFIETLGITTSPNGTDIVPGTTSEGDWVLVGTTTRRLWWWQAGLQFAPDDPSTSNNAYHLDVAVGDGTNFTVILQDHLFTANTAEAFGSVLRTNFCQFDVPAGSNIYARVQTITLANAYTCAVYGMGG